MVCLAYTPCPPLSVMYTALPELHECLTVLYVCAFAAGVLEHVKALTSLPVMMCVCVCVSGRIELSVRVSGKGCLLRLDH